VGRREYELAIYRRIAADPPAVVIPRLRYADDRLTVLTRVPGSRLGDEQHLTEDLPTRTVDVVLDTLDAFAGWMPHPPLPEPIADFHGRVDAEHTAGLLDGADRASLHQLVDACGDTRVAAHGDPLPANLLLADGRCTVIDFEHCGRYPLIRPRPAIHRRRYSQPHPRRRDNRPRGRPRHRRRHAINLALVVAREIRTPLPDSPQKNPPPGRPHHAAWPRQPADPPAGFAVIIAPLRVAHLSAVRDLMTLGAPYIRARDLSDFWLYANHFASTRRARPRRRLGAVIALPSQDQPDDVYIQDVMVQPTAQRTAIATALLAVVAARAAGWGGARLYLASEPDNTAAHTAWLSMGFTNPPGNRHVNGVQVGTGERPRQAPRRLQATPDVRRRRPPQAPTQVGRQRRSPSPP
jgi:GNAT superfamily N-acetyltransferase